MQKPKIIVLLATYNGIQWLPEQIDSILNQRDVDLQIVVSDDQSTDGTHELLQNYTNKDSRVTLLPSCSKFGCASKNFYRLMVEVDFSTIDYIAFADQDDIWVDSKLSDLAKIAHESNSDGVSSNVIAFWEDGRRSLVNKANPQTKLDFLFECSGPGCTFLMTPWLVQQAKLLLNEPTNEIDQIFAHDWLMYAICRSYGRLWTISSLYTVRYRQHLNNELGVHKGIKARWKRFQRLQNGTYKGEVIKISHLCLQVTEDAYVKEACKVIVEKGFLQRIKLLRYFNHCRRSMSGRILFAFAVIFNFYR